MLHNNAENRISRLHHGRSLRSCTVLQKLLQSSTKYPEDEDRKLLQNARKLSTDMVSKTRRLWSSSTLLQKPPNYILLGCSSKTTWSTFTIRVLYIFLHPNFLSIFDNLYYDLQLCSLICGNIKELYNSTYKIL